MKPEMGLNQRRTMRVVALAAVCTVLSAAGPIAWERPVSLPDAQIEAALRIASDDQAARAFLDMHRLQTRNGGEAGPVLGWLSTPFSRIVLAGLAARKAGHTLTRDEVSADPLSSELVVIAAPQPAAAANTLAHVTEIAVETRAGTEVTDVLLPMRMRPATAQERTLHGMETAGEAVVAVFSLEAIAPILEARDAHVVVRVTFDKVTKGSTPLTACQDCVVAISDR